MPTPGRTDLGWARALAALLLLAGCARPAGSPGPAVPATPDPFVLHARTRTPEGTAESILRWNPKETAVIICDMWDDHTCKGAARRVGEMVPRLNAFLRAARARGALVIHAPSDVIPYYDTFPQRRRVLAAPPVPAPIEIKRRPYDASREGPFPFNNDLWHCDCTPRCPDVRPYPWTREHPGIEMAPEDAISADGREIWNLSQSMGITRFILTGVHTNYCILARSFGIRQMVLLGRPVVLVRDLTDALYDPKEEPHVSHERGTQLVIEHIERYWCPTILGRDLTGP